MKVRAACHKCTVTNLFDHWFTLPGEDLGSIRLFLLV